MTTPLPLSVPAFIAGYGPQQSDMQTLVTGPMQFMQQRMVLRVRQTVTGTTLPSSGAATVIAFDTVDEDPYSGWNASTHSWTPPAGYSGWFQVTITLFGGGNGSNNLVLVPSLNVPVATGDLADVCVGSAQGGAEGTAWCYLVGGQDSVQGVGQIAGAASNYTLSTTAGQNSSMEIIWLAS